MIKSPVNLEILLHCYYSAEQHPRANTLAVREAIDFLMENGLVEGTEEIGVWKTTKKADFYIHHLLNTPFPVTTYTIPERQP